jgi:hypothetical protein
MAQVRNVSAPEKAKFPGNVDPQTQHSPDFDNVLMEFSQHKAGEVRPGHSKPKVIQVLNDKGLVPGNVPPEMGDILKVVEAANKQYLRALSVELIPGNIPPDAPFPGAKGKQVLSVEFSPAGVPDKQAVNALTMQLTPGNIPPEMDTILSFLGASKAVQISSPAHQAGPSSGVATSS